MYTKILGALLLSVAATSIAAPSNGRNIEFNGNDKINVIADPRGNGNGVRDNPNACLQSALACAPIIVNPPVVNPPVVNPPVVNPPVVNPPVVNPPVVNPPVVQAAKAGTPCVQGWGYCRIVPLDAKRKPPVIDEVIEYITE